MIQKRVSERKTNEENTVFCWNVLSTEKHKVRKRCDHDGEQGETETRNKRHEVGVCAIRSAWGAVKDWTKRQKWQVIPWSLKLHLKSWWHRKQVLNTKGITLESLPLWLWRCGEAMEVGWTLLLERLCEAVGTKLEAGGQKGVLKKIWYVWQCALGEWQAVQGEVVKWVAGIIEEDWKFLNLCSPEQ